MAQIGKTLKPLGLTQKYVDIICDSVGLKLTILSPWQQRLLIPSLSPDFFLREQRYIPYNMIKLTNTCSLFWPLYTTKPDESVVTVIRSLNVQFNPSIYLDTPPKLPLVINNDIQFVKNSSRGLRMEVRHPDATSPYIIFSSVDVNIDPVSMRTKKIPDWWKKEYGPPLNGNGYSNLQDSVFSVKPQHGVFASERKLHFWDVDMNGHTNFSSYVRLCLDTFYENIENNKSAHSYKNFLAGWVKEVNILFKGDSIAGDILTIEFWEDGTSTNTFCFEIRNGARVILIAHFRFYQSLINSSL